MVRGHGTGDRGQGTDRGALRCPCPQSRFTTPHPPSGKLRCSDRVHPLRLKCFLPQQPRFRNRQPLRLLCKDSSPVLILKISYRVCTSGRSSVPRQRRSPLSLPRGLNANVPVHTRPAEGTLRGPPAHRRTAVETGTRGRGGPVKAKTPHPPGCSSSSQK